MGDKMDIDIEDAMQPHAYHMNLPPHHKDGDIPYVTKYAHRKTRLFVSSVFSIKLSDRLFVENGAEAGSAEDTTGMEDEVDDDEEDVTNVPDESESNPHRLLSTKDTLHTVSRRCSRLVSQLNTLDTLKYGGIRQREFGGMILHLLRLLTCTKSTDEDGNVQLHFENVGYMSPYCEVVADSLHSTLEDLEADLKRPFTLPSPAREALLSVLVSLLSYKGNHRPISNLSVYLSGQDDRVILILHWKVLLRLLLRTAPYLDEHKTGNVPMDSSSRQNTVLKRTVQLIRDCRRFFDQGVRPPSSKSDEGFDSDKAANEIWEMTKNDVLYHAYTHACYRATIILYLFLPSRCSTEFYQSVMPMWWDSWTGIDRCPEFDFLWLTLFCRARRYMRDDAYDWTMVRKRLLTNCQYWLQLPIGGTAMDKSFPMVSNPRTRSCPPRLKAIVGSSSSYEEGIDFVAKVAKLLVNGLGMGGIASRENCQSMETDTMTMQKSISNGTSDILRFLSYVAPYFHPSNVGNWTFTLGAFLHYFAYELACRVGTSAGLDNLRQTRPELVKAYTSVQAGPTCDPIPAHEIVLLLHSLLPLCQQTLYSKNGHVGRAGEAAMLYLIQVDPAHSTPFFVDFATRALDISAVNLAHQAPSALSALTRLVQPSLRSSTSSANFLFVRLPEILRLSLAGIDSNDQNKTLRTLIFYRNLTSWIPVGGDLDQLREQGCLPLEDNTSTEVDGTIQLSNELYQVLETSRSSPEYLQAVERLPDESVLQQCRNLVKECDDVDSTESNLSFMLSSLGDWALEFLDRVFDLLRASGEREKTGKTTSGVATRHSVADANATRNFSRVLKECLSQFFAAMSDDVHKLAVRSVCRFLSEESLPAAAKDASLLCQAVAAARRGQQLGQVSSPGLNALMPVLTDGLRDLSAKTAVYRLRCVAGAVRLAGMGVVDHREEISMVLNFALGSNDRHVFKAGCKILRHTLSSLSESYPLSTDCNPRVYKTASSVPLFGRSSQLHKDQIQWHVPNKECVSFMSDLLEAHLFHRLNSLCEVSGIHCRLFSLVDTHELKKCLRVVRYCIRGGASVLVDHVEGEVLSSEDIVPYEMASHHLLCKSSEPERKSILSLRMRLASFIISLSAIVSSDTLFPDDIQKFDLKDCRRKSVSLIGSDPKVCKETCLIAMLLLTRRGGSFRSQEARTIWKAQKQLATNFPLSAQVDQIAETLQSAALYGEDAVLLYKDGERSGKSLPRRLLVSRVRLYHDSLQRNASFEVPRRLRRAIQNQDNARTILFQVKGSLPAFLQHVDTLLTASPRPLDAYEGISDGLCALCCHSNTEVRASAIGVVDYAVTRFAWFLAPRVSRLMSAISIRDESMNGKFGFPSCAMLVDKLDHQGKRKRLSEAIKGVCSILSLTRSVKHLLGTERMRLMFAQTVCGTDRLVSLLPPEEVQKVVQYLQAVFMPFRSKLYHLPRISKIDFSFYAQSLSYSNDILAEKKVEAIGEVDEVVVHWRKLLLGCWFLLNWVDGDERDISAQEQYSRTWDTCFQILENEAGQPLQRVALGLFGRLTSLILPQEVGKLRSKMVSEGFCKVFAGAIMFDHREDSSIGGGHDAQWSAGVEDIIRDAAKNVSQKTLFPFRRTSQSMASFKVTHCQLVERVLLLIGSEAASKASSFLLTTCAEMAAAAPSEDQRNEQIASAEIFAGVFGYTLRHGSADIQQSWPSILVPHIESVVSKVPFSMTSAYFDALRYAIQFSQPLLVLPLIEWLTRKVVNTLWQPTENSDTQDLRNASTGTEGFTAQSKWLHLLSAVLIEMGDDSDGSNLWYTRHLLMQEEANIQSKQSSSDDMSKTWSLLIDDLLPRLIGSMGHPFDSCRDHISRCLFRICYHHGRQLVIPENSRGYTLLGDRPGTIVVNTCRRLANNNDKKPFFDRYNALSTTRRFMSYCVSSGECKFEYANYVIPLLQLAFQSLESTMNNDGPDAGSDENVAKVALEGEVIKAYRFMLAEVSVSAVISYDNESDLSRVLDVVDYARNHKTWQVRHASANFLRCFQGAHQFLFSDEQADRIMTFVAALLADERREVSSAAMAALTGILAASPEEKVSSLVTTYSTLASKSKMERSKKKGVKAALVSELTEADRRKEEKRAKNQQSSVFFLCAAVLSRPYDTPKFVPEALASMSKHSFERAAPLGVREIVKRCCAEFKRTHLSDNWELHRRAFTQEQLEALEDVVSTPHYYA